MNKVLSLEEQTEVMHSVMDEKMHVSLSLSLTEDVVTELNKQHHHIVQFVDEPEKIYVVYSVEADSYNGREFPKSYHKTLEGAIAAIPESDRKRELKTRSYSQRNVVKDYTYFNIQEQELKD